MKGKYKVPPKSSASTLRAVESRSDATVSLGFVVEGFSPDHLRAAELDHNRDRDGQKGRDLLPREKALGPWDAEVYMRTTKAKRVRSKPYKIEQAADLCADMARKAGWRNVVVTELLRG